MVCHSPIASHSPPDPAILNAWCKVRGVRQHPGIEARYANDGSGWGVWANEDIVRGQVCMSPSRHRFLLIGSMRHTPSGDLVRPYSLSATALSTRISCRYNLASYSVSITRTEVRRRVGMVRLVTDDSEGDCISTHTMGRWSGRWGGRVAGNGVVGWYGSGETAREEERRGTFFGTS